MWKLASLVVACLLVAPVAQADVVTVTITGQVVGNFENTPPVGDINVGESLTVSFDVDSDNFTEGVPGDTRGYEIDQSSFVMSFSGGVELGLIDPFPVGETPYFTLVEGFPVSDGFFVSTSPFSPGGVPISQDPINFNFDLGYVGETLASLDILDALGTYGFDGLTRFGFNLWKIVPDNVGTEFEFESMTIESAATPVLDASWGEVKAQF